jgi:hypothetical protein
MLDLSALIQYNPDMKEKAEVGPFARLILSFETAKLAKAAKVSDRKAYSWRYGALPKPDKIAAIARHTKIPEATLREAYASEIEARRARRNGAA